MFSKNFQLIKGMAILLITVLGIWAQGSITVSGFVRDETTKAGIGGATVWVSYLPGDIRPTVYSVVTGLDGSYSINFPNIQRAWVDMTTSADGYFVDPERAYEFTITENIINLEKDFLLSAVPGPTGDLVVISGVIAAPDQSIIPGAVITIQAGTGANAVVATGISGVDGSFSLSMQNTPKASLLTATVTAPGYKEYESSLHYSLSVPDPADGITDSLGLFYPQLEPLSPMVTVTVSGKVLNSETQTTAAGAQVVICTGNTHTFITSVTTGNLGDFSSLLSIEEYRRDQGILLIVSSPGFQDSWSRLPADSAIRNNFNFGSMALEPVETASIHKIHVNASDHVPGYRMHYSIDGRFLRSSRTFKGIYVKRTLKK